MSRQQRPDTKGGAAPHAHRNRGLRATAAARGPAANGGWSPPVDVRELPDEYIVLADLPGVEPGAIEVTADQDTLKIAAARRDRLRAGGVPLRLERPTGTVST
jgi:HSP20 family molecular chaperone IbpA